MQISEIYSSNQGEGRLTGQPSVFIRTSGCNLRCSFCDTPFASWEPSGEDLSVDSIVKQALSHQPRHAVVTGGEPMLPREIVQLTKSLKEEDFHITIETAGTIFRDVDCDLVSISPKMSNSTPAIGRAGEWQKKHEQTRLQPEVVSQLIGQHDYQLKFVVAEPDDMNEILLFLDSLSLPSEIDRSKILLMPEGIKQSELESREPWLLPICEQYGFTFCPRMHIVWYGNKRGT